MKVDIQRVLFFTPKKFIRIFFVIISLAKIRNKARQDDNCRCAFFLAVRALPYPVISKAMSLPEHKLAATNPPNRAFLSILKRKKGCLFLVVSSINKLLTTN